MKPLKPLMFGLPILALAACSSRWVPDMPDFSSWFDSENQVTVEEFGNEQQCKAAGEEPHVQILPDAPAVQAWQANRGISFAGGYGEMPKGPFAIVDLGQRPSGGYGIAVSRLAGLKDDTLVLKATFFTPAPGAVTTQALTSPCTLVRLPEVKFKTLRVIDQTGRVRATANSEALR